jgi:hypothetical protein
MSHSFNIFLLTPLTYYRYMKHNLRDSLFASSVWLLGVLALASCASRSESERARANLLRIAVSLPDSSSLEKTIGRYSYTAISPVQAATLQEYQFWKERGNIAYEKHRSNGIYVIVYSSQDVPSDDPSLGDHLMVETLERYRVEPNQH